jgi:hypothetical protein
VDEIEETRYRRIATAGKKSQYSANCKSLHVAEIANLAKSSKTNLIGTAKAVHMCPPSVECRHVCAAQILSPNGAAVAALSGWGFGS